MHISLEIKDETISQKVLDFLATFKTSDVSIKTSTEKSKPNLASFSGMWKDKDITIETLRESAWKK